MPRRVSFCTNNDSVVVGHRITVQDIARFVWKLLWRLVLCPVSMVHKKNGAGSARPQEQPPKRGPFLKFFFTKLLKFESRGFLPKTPPSHPGPSSEITRARYLTIFPFLDPLQLRRSWRPNKWSTSSTSCRPTIPTIRRISEGSPCPLRKLSTSCMCTIGLRLVMHWFFSFSLGNNSISYRSSYQKII